MLAILLDYWLWESSSKKYFGPTIQHIYRKENMPAVQGKKGTAQFMQHWTILVLKNGMMILFESAPTHKHLQHKSLCHWVPKHLILLFKFWNQNTKLWFPNCGSCKVWKHSWELKLINSLIIQKKRNTYIYKTKTDQMKNHTTSIPEYSTVHNKFDFPLEIWPDMHFLPGQR